VGGEDVLPLIVETEIIHHQPAGLVAESVAPSLVGKRLGIQFLPMQSPLRHVLVHDRDEAIVMMPFIQMHEFMDGDVLQALHRLLREFEVQPNPTNFDIAASPLGFHFLDAAVNGLQAQNPLPFLQEWWQQFVKLSPIPPLQCAFALRSVGFSAHMEFDGGLVVQDNLDGAVVVNDAEPVSPPEKVMALAADHFAGGLARLTRKSGPLAFDPAELADDRKAHRFVADSDWRGYPYPAMRGINPQVQVLDVLADNLNRQATDGDLVRLNTHSGFSPVQGVGRERRHRGAQLSKPLKKSSSDEF
jgi:hypothetical protein